MSCCRVFAGVCCAAAVCVCNVLSGMNHDEVIMPPFSLSDGRDNLGLREITFSKLDKIKSLRLYDTVQSMKYNDIISEVPKYFDSSTHEFNENWWLMLRYIRDPYVISSIISDLATNVGNKVISAFYSWCVVTAEVVCNYDNYLLSEQYSLKIGKKLGKAVSCIRGDKSMLLDDFIEILLDPSAIFASHIPVKVQRWSSAKPD